MAANSKREQILEAIKTLMMDLHSIVTVDRTRPSFADLGNYAESQLPLIAIVGGLPSPDPKWSGREYKTADVIISDLAVELICFAMDNVTPDSTVSNLVDDIWAKVYSDPLLITDAYPEGLTLRVDVTPETKVGIWDPYVVFKMVCMYKYTHTMGGI